MGWLIRIIKKSSFWLKKDKTNGGKRLILYVYKCEENKFVFDF